MIANKDFGLKYGTMYWHQMHGVPKLVMGLMLIASHVKHGHPKHILPIFKMWKNMSNSDVGINIHTQIWISNTHWQAMARVGYGTLHLQQVPTQED